MTDMRLLTPHFARWEFTVSETAVRKNIDNTPPEFLWQPLQALCEHILEPARAALGPIRVTSGYRCPSLNALIGGAKNSQHMMGEAADVVPLDVTLAALFKWLYQYAPFDQLIWEFGEWVHVSYRDIGRREALMAYRHAGATTYTPMEREQILSFEG